MHVEKNIGESLLGTMLHGNKSKDGTNCRKDLEDWGIRKELHAQPRGNKTYLPPAPYMLSKSERKIFCKRLYDFKGPDGYCSNLKNRISLQDCKISGLKSHDYHVLMQHLLPVASRGLMVKKARKTIIRLCSFFNKLCQRVLDREKVEQINAEIIEVLCELEKYFPPSFFDIMVHLSLHLAKEALMCGPVHFRWMYPFERYMKTLKDYVRNYARPEGCIAESYLARECMMFFNEFLKKSGHIEEKEARNEDYGSGVILEGRQISTSKTVKLSANEKEMAHLAVLMNMAVVEPFIE